jgi:hypothetical protein
MMAREEERCCIMYFGHGVNIVRVMVRNQNSETLFDAMASLRAKSLNVELVDSQISDLSALEEIGRN